MYQNLNLHNEACKAYDSCDQLVGEDMMTNHDLGTSLVHKVDLHRDQVPKKICPSRDIVALKQHTKKKHQSTTKPIMRPQYHSFRS